MRIRTLVAVAALSAAGVATSMAQNVYSLNVVGYYNVTVPAGKYAIIANQLVQSDSTVASILNVPGGTQLLKWSGTSFIQNNFDPDFGWDDPAMTLVPGEGAFIKNNGTADFTVTFVGEVNQNSNDITFTAGNFKLVSIFTPQAGKIQTDFGFPAAGNDTVLQWTGTGYNQQVYDPDFGWDSEPTLGVGEGFFVKTATNKTWTRQFTVPQ